MRSQRTIVGKHHRTSLAHLVVFVCYINVASRTTFSVLDEITYVYNQSYGERN